MRGDSHIILLPVFLIMASASNTAPPWTAEPSWQTESREIRFDNEGTEFVGTLYYPKGAENVPAAIALHGSSAGERDDPVYEHLIEILPALGIAVYIYDRRGSGESRYDTDKSLRYDMLARDAVAAKRTVAAEEEVNGAKVGYWGISQGGWIAMRAAIGREPAFLIIVSTPLISAPEQMIFVARYALLLEGYSEEIADRAEAARRKYDALVRGEARREEAIAAIEAVRDEPWYELMLMPVDKPRQEILDSENYADSSWLLEMRTDYSALLADVTAPALFIYGTKDALVPVERTTKELSTVPAHSERDVVVIPGASHVMRIVDRPRIGGDSVSIPDSKVYFATLGQWSQKVIQR